MQVSKPNSASSRLCETESCCEPVGADVSNEYKVCPSCLEEFTLVAVECADCQVALVSPHEIDPEEEPEDFPELSELECVRVGPLPWTRALSDALTQSEIGHRVEGDTRSEAEGGIDPRRFGGEVVFGTWVKPDDFDGAKAIDGALFAHLEPGNEEAAPEDEVCPACQEPLPGDAVECTGCGLSFG